MPRYRTLLVAAVTALVLANPQLASAQRQGPAAARVAKTPLPAVARTKQAQKYRDRRIEAHRRQYLQKKAEGRLGVKSAKQQKVERKIAAMAKELGAALQANPPKRPVLIILEGADGAGKSSTIRRLMPAFQGLPGFSVEHFGAPPKGADRVEELARYQKKVPSHSAVTIWDRSWYGPTRFNDDNSIRSSVKTKDAKSRIRDVRHLEGLYKGKVKVVKIYLDASKDRQAKTIAKREVMKPKNLSEWDYLSYSKSDQIKANDKRVRKKTEKHIPWHVISMDDRGRGRIQLLELLQKELLAER